MEDVLTVRQLRAWQAANSGSKAASPAAGTEAATVGQVARAMGIKAAPPLPQGYTRLEYIEGDGGQYIDTGYFPCELTRVVTAITPTSGNTTSGVFGGRTDNDTATFSLWCTEGVYRTDFYMAPHTTTAVSVSGRIEVDKNMGTTRLGSKTYSKTGSGFRAANSMHLFAVNPDEKAPRYFHGRIEAFTIYESGLLEHELVPARRGLDGAVGMYDTVGGTFLGNSGAGAFKAGPAVPEAVPGAGALPVTTRQFGALAKSAGGGEETEFTMVEWVESTGGQWIDTGFRPGAETVVDAEFEFIDVFDTFIFGSRSAGGGSSDFCFLYAEDKNAYRDDSGESKIYFFEMPQTGWAEVHKTAKETKLTVEGTSMVLDQMGAVLDERSAYSMYLCAVNNGGEAQKPSRIRVKKFDVLDYGDPVLKLRPVKGKRTGEACLIDMLTGDIYRNQGSGSLVAGPIG